MLLALDKYLWFQKTKELTNAGIILDLGGGEGMFETLFQGRDQRFAILEISPPKNTLRGNVEYIVYGGEEFPFSNQSFDLGIALHAIEHVPRHIRPRVIAELVRVVRHRIILAFPMRRLHFEQLFRAIFTLYAAIGLSKMKRFYEEHLRYGLPTPHFISSLVGSPPTSSEFYFGKLSCLVLLIQLTFPVLVPLSGFFARTIRKLDDREPVFALLWWRF